MFDKFVPDIYQKSIYTIDYNKLKTSGIRCLIFDLDNTISPTTLSKPTIRLKNHFTKLKQMGFKCIILSNSGKKRVEPFKNELAVDAGAYSKKPKDRKYLKIMDNYKFIPNEIAMIGDQLLTDVYAANKLGLTSVLVNQMGAKDFFNSIFNRTMEKIIFKFLKAKDLFCKGRYYD